MMRRTPADPTSPRAPRLRSLPAFASLDQELHDCDPSMLTSLPDKAALYREESYFREAWADASEVLGARAIPLLQRVALAVFQPDAWAGRRAHVAIEFLRERGFVPVLLRPFRYTRTAVREDWRYQMNNLTLDRMRLSTLANLADESLLVAFRDDDRPMQVPASVRLAELKGPALPRLRRPDHLRTVLGSPDRMIKFMHSADEPADVLRELGILFDRPARRRVLARLCDELDGDVVEPLAAAVARRYAAAPAHDFDPSRALARIRTRIALRARSCRHARAALHELDARLGPAAPDEPLPLSRLEAILQRARVDPPRWDFIVVAAQHVRHKYEHPARIASNGAEGWRSGRGRLASPASLADPRSIP